MSTMEAQHALTDRARAAKMMPVVKRIARRLAKRLPRSVDVDDLIGAGLLGLTMAIRRCQSEPDNVFEAYAVSRIRGEMLEELRRMDPLSRHQRDNVRRVEQAERMLRQKSCRSIPPKAIAAEAGMTEDKYREATLLRVAGSPHGQLDSHEGPLPRYRGARMDVDEMLDRQRAWRRLQSAIRTLPARLQGVLASHARGMTLQQIGQELGVSEARVCQLRGKALRLLKQRSAVPTIAQSARPVALGRVA